jgi:predicted phage terminase large subunit-like protein
MAQSPSLLTQPSYPPTIPTNALRIKAPDWIEDLLVLGKYRHKVFWGGRGGAKSQTFAKALILLAIQHKLFIVCGREIQKSIEDSVKKLLDDTIEQLGLKDYFHSTHNRIICKTTDTKFSFIGLRYDTDGVKSLEGCDIFWGEEAQSFSAASIEDVFPTIRKPGSEIWLSYNSKTGLEPVHVRFVTIGGGKRDLVRKVNFYNNPFCTAEMLEEAALCKAVSPIRYRSVWLGEPGLVEGQIFPPSWWSIYASREEIDRRITHKWITADTAFEEGAANDFSAIQCWGAEGRQRLYLLDEVFGKWEYPLLVEKASTFWKKHTAPGRSGSAASIFWIEKKASGHSLIQTLRTDPYKIRAKGWRPKDFRFPDNKTAGFKEASNIVAPTPVVNKNTGDLWIPDDISGDVWLPDDTIYSGTSSLIEHMAAINGEESQEHDDRGDALKMAVAIWRKMGGGRKGNVAKTR